MAQTKLGGNPVNTNGELPKVGTKAIDFELIGNALDVKTLKDFQGVNLILNIFPSIDTGTCATSVRTFNEKASSLENTKVLCISRDLPFAQKRFCGAEGIDNALTLSDFKTGGFGKNYGLELIDSGMNGLHARAVIVLNSNHEIVYEELVSEIANEPNYEAALASL